jgi:hypothetical protein
LLHTDYRPSVVVTRDHRQRASEVIGLALAHRRFAGCALRVYKALHILVERLLGLRNPDVAPCKLPLFVVLPFAIKFLIIGYC